MIYKFDPNVGHVSFLAKGHPALISIDGVGKGLSGELTEVNHALVGTLSFNLNTLDTGISLRNTHMKEKYLDTKDHPNALIIFSNFVLPKNQEKSFPFTAELELKGIRKPVTGIATVQDENGKSKIFAEFPIQLSQFDVNTPSFKGITVAEEVKIKIEVSALKK
jgi:polyisoprenoid-binding protein YceI